MVTVTGDDFDTIQIVNFYNPLRTVDNPRYEAIATADVRLERSTLLVVDLPHLIALKLYAGGPKSKLDVVELLERNPLASRSEIGAVCGRYGAGEDLQKLLVELGETWR